MWTLCHVHGTLFSLIHIAFACSLGVLPTVSLGVHRVRRLILFTYENALASIDRSEQGERGRIRVITSSDQDGVRLDVWDNGAALGKVDPEQIFSQDGLTEWFGLHYCANALKEMSGRIEIGMAENGDNRVSLWFPT